MARKWWFYRQSTRFFFIRTSTILLSLSFSFLRPFDSQVVFNLNLILETLIWIFIILTIFVQFRQMFIDFSFWSSNVIIFFKISGLAVLNLFLILLKSEAHCSYKIVLIKKACSFFQRGKNAQLRLVLFIFALCLIVQIQAEQHASIDKTKRNLAFSLHWKS